MKKAPEAPLALLTKLEQAIRAGNAGLCVAALRGTSERERQAAFPRVSELAAEAEKDWRDHPGGGEMRLERSTAVHVAALGTATASAFKKFSIPWALDPVFEVLADRRPPWLAEWAEWALSPQRLWIWGVVRRLVRAGLIRRPQGEAYTLGLMQAGSQTPPGELLREDPELLEEEVWRLFEVEGTQQVSMANCDKFGQAGDGWSEALAACAESGRLSRARLLDASLDALERDFSPYRAAWYSRFHEQLRPVLEERNGRVERYLSLIGSRAPATVAFAVNAVDQVERKGRIDRERVVEMLGPALVAREKGTVTKALRVLDRIAGRVAGLRALVAASAASALSHESSEVQKAALDLIERYAEPGDRTVLVEPYREGLAASLRSKLGIGTGSGEAAPLEFGAPDAMAPIRDLEDLVERLGAVIERGEPAREIERVIEGVTRWFGERPPEFGRLTEALARRAEKVVTRRKESWRSFSPFEGGFGQPQAALAALALAWIRGTKFSPRGSVGSLVDWQLDRLLRVCEQAPPKALPQEDVARLAKAPCTGDPAMLRWCALAAEDCYEAWFTGGCKRIEANLDWWSAEWGNRVYLETLVEAPKWGAMTRRLAALGLGAKEAGEGMAAADAVVLAIGDNRLDGAALGEAMVGAASSGHSRPGRWAKRLGAVAKVSRKHAVQVFAALEKVAGAVEMRPAEMSAVLELLRELGCETGLRLSDAKTIRRLRAVRSGGKTGGLIRELLPR